MGLISTLARRDFDKMLKEKLDEIKIAPIFNNSFSNGYLNTHKLAGYKYLTITLTGFLEINTTVGCELTFHGGNESLELRSESDIIEGSYSDISKIGITQFDLDFPTELAGFIRKNGLDKITLKTKNGQFFKRKVAFEYDQVNESAFLKALSSGK